MYTIFCVAGKGVASVTSFFFFNLVKDFIKTTQPASIQGRRD